MIIQRSLIIHNGCQHKDINVDFTSGVTYAVIGKNACGKTNLLQLNMYGLLGMVNKSWGSQKDFNRTGTKDGYVEVCIHNTDTNTDVYVRRHFTAGTKNPDRLWYGDTNHEPDIMGREVVNEALQSMYGVSCKILFELLYMRQGMTNWLLTAPSTSIYTFMNSIFDTSKFKKIREVLMDAANSIALYEVDHSRVEFLKGQIAILESMVYENTKPMQDELADTRKKLASVQSDGRMSESEYTEKMDSLLKTKQGADRILSDAVARLESIDVNPVPWLTDEHRDFVKQFNDVSNRIADIMAEETKEWWGFNTTEKDVERVNNTLKDICKHIEEVESSIEVFLKSDVCPFCSGEIHDNSVYKTNLERIFAGDSYEEFKQRKVKLTAELDALKKEHKRASEYLIQLDNAADTLKKFIDDNKSTYNTIEDAIGRHRMWQLTLENRDSFVKAVDTAKDNLKAVMDQIDELKSHEVVLDKDKLIRELTVKISDLESRISIINSTKVSDSTKLNSYRSELESRAKDLEKNQKNQSMFDRIMRVREGASNKRIPARYLNDKVDKLNGELEAYCRMANMDVILFLDKDDFVFRFTDGKDVRPTGQLSGAQQTLCSTILQLALVRVVNPRLGVIQMDEPTVFLDPTNRAKLLSLFESLSSVLSTTGTITIVPTHDVDLINACNERIEL